MANPVLSGDLLKRLLDVCADAGLVVQDSRSQLERVARDADGQVVRGLSAGGDERHRFLGLLMATNKSPAALAAVLLAAQAAAPPVPRGQA